jgi:predicted restriction endonuclease
VTVQVYRSKRYFRDPRKSALLKDLYDHRCQICNIRITDVDGKPYAETHHIRQRSEGGEDEITNMLVLCPNHHIMFELGSAGIDLYKKEVQVNLQPVGWTNKHL